jgi:hypothetical protein
MKIPEQVTKDLLKLDPPTLRWIAARLRRDNRRRFAFGFLLGAFIGVLVTLLAH